MKRSSSKSIGLYKCILLTATIIIALGIGFIINKDMENTIKNKKLVLLIDEVRNQDITELSNEVKQEISSEIKTIESLLNDQEFALVSEKIDMLKEKILDEKVLNEEILKNSKIQSEKEEQDIKNDLNKVDQEKKNIDEETNKKIQSILSIPYSVFDDYNNNQENKYEYDSQFGIAKDSNDNYYLCVIIKYKNDSGKRFVFLSDVNKNINFVTEEDFYIKYTFLGEVYDFS